MSITSDGKEPEQQGWVWGNTHLVAIMFDEVKHKATIHEWEEVVQEESQADVDLFRLFNFLKNKHTNTHIIWW